MEGEDRGEGLARLFEIGEQHVQVLEARDSKMDNHSCLVDYLPVVMNYLALTLSAGTM